MVVDADYLVYACGFAVERTRYDVSVLRPDGTTAETVKESRDEVAAWLSDEPESSVRQIDPMVDAEPLANALHLVNRTLTAVDQNLTAKGIDFDRMELFITGSGNFRNDLATIRGYKANRDPLHRPVHYKSIRRYLKARYGATEVRGYEADDAVAMLAYECNFDPERLIIVSVDKDLLTIPGRHYNFKSKQMLDVSPQDALVNFYRQVITGDVVDNIGGCYRSGPKAALVIQPDLTEYEMYAAALAMYTKSMEKNGCPYANMSAEDALLENARLLHLLRYMGDVWAPPVDKDKSSGVPSMSEGFVSDSTGKLYLMGTRRLPSTSSSPSPADALLVGPSTSSESPCTPPISSSASGPSKRKGSSRPKTASGFSPS